MVSSPADALSCWLWCRDRLLPRCTAHARDRMWIFRDLTIAKPIVSSQSWEGEAEAEIEQQQGWKTQQAKAQNEMNQGKLGSFCPPRTST